MTRDESLERNPTGSEMIAMINAYQLSPDLLLEAAEGTDKEHPSGDAIDDFNSRTMLAVLSFGVPPDDQVTAGMAIQFRLSALSTLLKSEGARGFQHEARGKIGHFVNPAVMRCAAIEPLLDQEGPVSFDAESFRRRLLGDVGPVGRA